MNRSARTHIENAIEQLEMVVENTRSSSAGVRINQALDEIRSAVDELFDHSNHLPDDHPVLTAQSQLQALVADHADDTQQPNRNFVTDETPADHLTSENMVYDDAEINEVVPVVLDLLEVSIEE